MRRRDPADNHPLVRACRRAGVRDPRILQAVADVDRSTFVPTGGRRAADRDAPILIGSSQTTSQPSLIARMIQELDLPDDGRVLEVGTGSGYQTALLARLAGEVVSIERDPDLAEAAAARLEGFPNVELVVGDGSLGWPARAPYDAITVGACAPHIPDALVAQLGDDGVLVIPVDAGGREVLTRVRAVDGTIQPPEELTEVRFVPLVGEDAFDAG